MNSNMTTAVLKYTQAEVDLLVEQARKDEREKVFGEIKTKLEGMKNERK